MGVGASGALVGTLDGVAVGIVGVADGEALTGATDGEAEGAADGEALTGAADGKAAGAAEGVTVGGNATGAADGAGVGITQVEDAACGDPANVGQ